MRGSGRFLAEGEGYHYALLFQSPSLRGSGRFNRRRNDTKLIKSMFQSPSLRGSGRFEAPKRVDERLLVFQSPSLRGSGRFRVEARGG